LRWYDVGELDSHGCRAQLSRSVSSEMAQQQRDLAQQQFGSTASRTFS